MKNTKQKEAILEAVRELKIHPTADEIYSSLKKDNERLSLGTVYRNLSTFSDNGIIRKVNVPGYGDRFDYRLDPHHHILCEKCGRVYDVESDLNIGELFKEAKAKITGYTFMLYGICENCQ